MEQRKGRKGKKPLYAIAGSHCIHATTKGKAKSSCHPQLKQVYPLVSKVQIDNSRSYNPRMFEKLCPVCERI
jgi:hypothetical protein